MKGDVHGDESVDVLILGAGWTSTFLIPLLKDGGDPHERREEAYTFAATTTSGRDGTIAFTFDPSGEDQEEEKKKFERLPDASTVLIVFPIKVKGGSERLVQYYEQTRRLRSYTDQDEKFASSNKIEASRLKRLYIQLGSTGIWDVS